MTPARMYDLQKTKTQRRLSVSNPLMRAFSAWKSLLQMHTQPLLWASWPLPVVQQCAPQWVQPQPWLDTRWDSFEHAPLRPCQRVRPKRPMSRLPKPQEASQQIFKAAQNLQDKSGRIRPMSKCSVEANQSYVPF